MKEREGGREAMRVGSRVGRREEGERGECECEYGYECGMKERLCMCVYMCVYLFV